MKTIITGILFMIISGCASTYKPPETGKTATVTIAGLTFNRKPFGSIFNDAANCTDGESLSESQLKKEIPIKIRAAELFTFSLGWSLDKGSCGGTYSFTPKEGRLYQINFQMIFSRKMCGVMVLEKDPLNSTTQKIEIRGRYWEGVFSGKCKPLKN